MKKGVITLLIIAGIAMAIFFACKNGYNNMVLKQETVAAQWSNVENQYQRRLDLIPNLVNTVKGYAAHESETLTAVIEARAQATRTNISINELNLQTLSELNKSQGALSAALGKLMAIAESYPDLKANQNFRDLQVQLEGTENRIATERRKFNEAARAYNSYIRQFPRNLFASMFGFDKQAYFEAEQGAATAPKVEF
ncbi:MAG: LemA family protein [Rikenellaceae bacterium]|nr:LemA family protein [Rikenellaceae bacterium]